MQIYLPIAEISVDIFTILLVGGGVGVLSGMFGIGGGFLMTPLLIFLGISPAVAVPTCANQIVASSLSSFLTHLKRGNVDFKIGFLLVVGSLSGSFFGVWLFQTLKELGQIDIVISISYVVFLGSIGSLMAFESVRTIIRRRRNITINKKEKKSFITKLPFKTYFPRSDVEISLILPVFIGICSGILGAMLGIGGGFVVIPAMIYLLKVPTSVVVGTSLFHIIFTTSNITILQSIKTQTVDVVLAVLLLTGSVIGAQVGTKIGAKLPAENLRSLLALVVLLVTFKLAYGLFVEPEELFTLLGSV